jgi:hypothetical protein
VLWEILLNLRLAGWSESYVCQKQLAQNLRAGCLIQTIAAALNLKQCGLVSNMDTLHLVVENFMRFCGEFPLELLHQLLSNLVINTLERSNAQGLLALVQIGGGIGLVFMLSYAGFQTPKASRASNRHKSATVPRNSHHQQKTIY